MTNTPRNSIETHKTNRLQIRIDDDSYLLLERAASYNHESLSRFVRNASLNKAQQVLHQHESLRLSAKDWDTFLDALTHPPLPNENLKKAFAHYKKIFP